MGDKGIWERDQFSAGADFRGYGKGSGGQMLDKVTQGDQLYSESMGLLREWFALHLCRTLVQSSVPQTCCLEWLWWGTPG